MDKYQSNIFKQVLNQQSPNTSPNLTSSNSNNGGFSNLFKQPQNITTNNNNSHSFGNIFKEIESNNNSNNTSPPNNIFSTPNNSTNSGNNSKNIFIFNNNGNTSPQEQQQQSPLTQPIFVQTQNQEKQLAESIFSRNFNKLQTPTTINIPIEKESPPIYTTTSNSYIYGEEISSEVPIEYTNNLKNSKSIPIQTPINNKNNSSNNLSSSSNSTSTPNKTHKRFFSTSSLSISRDGNGGSQQSNESTTAPSSPKTALFKSKLVDKVLTSVKNLSPQVDSLLSQFSNNSTPSSTPPEPNSVGSNRSNSSNNTNNTYSNNTMKPSELFPSSYIKKDNNPFMRNSTDSSEDSSLSSSNNNNNVTAHSTPIKVNNEEKKTIDFYSYYGASNLDQTEDSLSDNNNFKTSSSNLDNETLEVDLEFGIQSSSADITFLPSNSQNIPINDNINDDNIDNFIKEDSLEEPELNNFINSSDRITFDNSLKSSTNSYTDLESSKSSFSSSFSKHSNRIPTLNLPYKSRLFEEISTQQTRTERLLFSIPILDQNIYPLLGSLYDNYDSYDNYDNEDNIENDNTEDDIEEYDENNFKKSSSSKLIKAIREDISIQRFKPLPPTPNSISSSMHNQRFKPLPPLPNQPSYNKLSNILQLLSISIPSINDNNNNNTNSNIQYHSLTKSTDINHKYKEDLDQYLNEYGDKLKILQHINWHLEQPHTNIEIIKLLGTHYGFPENSRALSWKLINDYIPLNVNNRNSILLQKRAQYKDLIKKYYKDENKNKLFNNVWELVNSKDQSKEKLDELLQQVHLDVIRTRPEGFIQLFELKEIEKMMERVLVIWSLENSDVSYFQGLNDLLVPFLLVFLDSELLHCFNEQPQQPSYPMIEMVDPEFKAQNRIGDGKVVQDLLECGKIDALARVEADMYWCINNLLASVKHYARNTGSGLPAETLMKKLEKLVKVSNEELYQHFQQQGLDFSHFSFRWMVCFLTREFDIQTGIELWDRYMCDKDNEGFSLLHICFCAAILNLWTNDLLTKDFMELVQYLQKPPSLEYKSSPHLDVIFRNAIHLKETYRNFLIQ